MTAERGPVLVVGGTGKTGERYLLREVLDGRSAQLTEGMERALGRPPRDFRDHAFTTATTGVWAP